jgi:hypothetical protein
MDLDVLLVEAQAGVIDEAYSALQRSHVTHYELAGEAFTRQRLTELFQEVVDAIRTRNLGTLGAFVEQLALERFEHAFDVSEVQIAFNALEEAMWRRVVSTAPADELAEALGLLSTVLGFGKDAATRKYVSLASKRHVPSLDLSKLFAGAGS